MNLKRRVFGGAMAVAMAASLAIPALAAADPVKTGPNDTRKNGGNTIVAIYESTVNPANYSFEVPLYVTLGIIDNGDTTKTGPDRWTVMCPDKTAYYIQNNTKKADMPTTGDMTDGFIGVTGITATRVNGATFNTVASDDVNNAKENIYLNIGGLAVPALSAATLSAAFKLQSNTTFVKNYTPADMANTVFETIAPDGARKEIPIEGEIGELYNGSVNAAATAAVAQFRITYTVSPLDKDGRAVLTPYAGYGYGPPNIDAGLEKEFVLTTPDNQLSPEAAGLGAP